MNTKTEVTIGNVVPLISFWPASLKRNAAWRIQIQNTKKNETGKKNTVSQ